VSTSDQVYCWLPTSPRFSLDALRTYKGETITLELPGDLTIFNIDWFSIFDLETKENLGSIIIPEGLNVPPSLVKVFVSPGSTVSSY
jgi:hypothetical protein